MRPPILLATARASGTPITGSRMDRRALQYTDAGCAFLGLDRHVREVRRYRRMLSAIASLRKIDIDLKPKHRLLSMDFTGSSVNRDMEVRDSHVALISDWTEESRQSLKDCSFT